MIEVVWILLRKNDQFLLTQQSLGGTWIFPCCEVEYENINIFSILHKKLIENIGIHGKRFRKLLHMHLDKYSIHVFVCDIWRDNPKPSDENIIGIGWFTWAEMYSLGKSITPLVNNSLVYLSYLIQHYDNHPSEWNEYWGECDGDG